MLTHAAWRSGWCRWRAVSNSSGLVWPPKRPNSSCIADGVQSAI